MKLFNLDHRYNHSFETVTAAQFRKYELPVNPNVIAVDVIDRSIDKETGNLRTERLLSKIAVRQPTPLWINRIFGFDDNVSYVREVSVVDPKNKTFKAVSSNITFTSVFLLKEKVAYSVDPENLNNTVLDQTLQLDITANISMNSIKSQVEDMISKTITQNAEKGRVGMEKVINHIFKPEEMEAIL